MNLLMGKIPQTGGTSYVNGVPSRISEYALCWPQSAKLCRSWLIVEQT